MSNVMDRKVVEMQFDNSQFEKNVKTSISTIDKLKDSLKFEGLDKSFDNLERKTSKLDFSKLSGAVEEITYKFSVFEAVAFGALTRIGERAVDAGIKFGKALSVDNLTAGWSKFEEKTRSVGTLIAQGFDTSTVNSQLDRLNWYTDETSYSFTNMVAEIAKFTATGKGLEESVDAMIGIANWAAVSGQNASTASRAMYQLSQAMGSGLMRKEDYKSIQNVSMDTAEFRQKALDAGVALGTLKKNADGTYKSIVKGAKSSSFNISQFADHLTQDAWFTSDVMMEVFRDYGNAVDRIYSYAEENGITASEAIEDLSDELDEFGLKAFRAAQEARSWGDTVESVKEAVASGFMKTFEIVFGEYDDAVDLWTDLANRLYDVFAEPINGFNDILESGLKHSTSYIGKYMTDMFGVSSDLFEVLSGLAEANEGVEGFSIMNSQLQDIILNAVNGDKELAGLITDYTKMYKLVSDSEIATGVNTDELIKKTAELTGVTEDQISALKVLGDKYGYTSDQYKTKLQDVFGKGKKASYELVTGLLKVSNGLDLIQPRDLNKYLSDIYNLTGDQITKLRELSDEYGSNSVEVDKYINSLKNLKTSGFGDKKATKEAIKNLLELTNGAGKLAYTWRSGDVVSYISSITGASSDSVTILKDLIKTENELINTELKDDEAKEKNAKAIEENNKKIEEFADSISNGDEALKKEILSLLRLENGLSKISGYRNILSAFNNVWEYLAKIFSVVKDAFDELFPSLTADRIYEFTVRIKEATENLQLSEETADKLKTIFKGLFSVFRIFGQIIKPIVKPIKAFFNELVGSGEAILDTAVSIGDWITKLADSGKVAEISEKIFSKLSDVIRVVVKDFKELFNVQEIITIFNKSGGGFKGVLAVIKEKLKDIANGVLNFISVVTGWDPTAFKEKVKKVFSDIKDFFKKLFGKNEDYDSDANETLDKIESNTAKASEIFSKLKDGLLKFIQGVKNFFSKLGEYIRSADISKILEKAAKIIRTIWSGIRTVVSKVGEVLGKFFKRIADAFREMDTDDILAFFDRFIKLVGTVFSGLIGLEAVDAAETFVGFLKDIAQGFSEAIKTISGAFFGIEKYLELSSIKKLAWALLILAVALAIIAAIPVGKLYAATGVIAVLVNVLINAVNKLPKAGVKKLFQGSNFDSSALVKLAMAVLIIALAVKQFKDIDTQHIILGTSAIIGIIYALVGVAEILSNSKLKGKNVRKTATGLVILAIALRLIIWSVKEVVKLIEKDPNSALQGMIAVAGILLVLSGIAAILAATKHSSRVLSKAVGLIALALALRLIIWSVKAVVKLIESNPNSALQSMIAVGSMLVVLSGIATILSATKHSGRVFSKAVGLIALAVALRLIIWSVKEIVKLIDSDPSSILQSMIAVGAILAVLTGIATMLSATKHSGRVFSKAVGLIALALALRIVVASVSKLKEMFGSDPDATLNAVIVAQAMLVLLAAIAGIFSAIGGGGNMLAGSAAVIGLAVALGIMATVIGYMAKLSWTDLLKGIGAFAVVLGILVGAGYAFKPIIKYLLAGSAAMVLFGAGLVLVGAGLMLFGLGLDTIFGAITAFAGSFAASADLILFAITSILTGLIDLLPLLAQRIGEGIVVILNVISDSSDAVFAAIVQLLHVALGALKEVIPDIVTNAIETAKEVLESLIDNAPELVDKLFDFVIALIDGLAERMPGLIKSVVNLVESIIKGLVDAINQMNIGSAEEILDACLKLGEVLLALNGFALLVPGALLGVAGLGLLAAEIVGLLVLLAEINDTAGTLEHLQRGIDLLELVGSAIGRFVGSIIGGAADAISNSLPSIGSNLSAFMDNAKSFFDGASSLDSGIIDGVTHLAGAMLALTAANLVNSILGFVGLGVDWSDLGDNFASIGEAIKRFSESTEGINAESLTMVSEAMGPLVSLATSLPNTEGLWGWVSGKQDLGEFGIKLGDLATGLTSFAEASRGITSEDCESMINVANALDPIVDLSTKLPNTEGAWGWIAGKQDLGEFGNKLGDLATGLASFAEASRGITTEDCESMVNVANALDPIVDLSSKLPNTEGAWGWIAGKQDIGEFGTKLGDLAAGIKTFADNAKEISDGDIEHLKLFAPAIDPIVEIANKLPNSEGAWGWLSGKQGLDDFGDNLGSFGEGVAKFAENIRDIGSNDIKLMDDVTPRNSGTPTVAFDS